VSDRISTNDIAASLEARIQTVRAELEQFDALRSELARLESALATLTDGAASSGAQAPKRSTSGSAPKRRRAGSSSRRRPATARSAPSAQAGERIISYLRDHGPATAGEVAKALDLKRNSVGTRLTQLAKDGQIQKVLRGYAAPDSAGSGD
jgi:hypothetical protein